MPWEKPTFSERYGVNGGLAGAAVLGIVLTGLLGYIVSDATGDRRDDSAYVLGSAVGAMAFVLIIGLIVWKFGSPRTAAITVCVIAGLASCGSLGRLTQSASDDGSRSGGENSWVPSTSEDRCLRDLGFAESELESLLDDPTVDGANDVRRFMNGIFACAPEVVDDPSFVRGMAAGFESASGIAVSDAEMSCYLDAAAESDDPAAFFFADDPPATFEAVESCFDDDVLAALGGEPTSEALIYGDEPVFDLLFDSCADGRAAACDVVRWTAVPGSEYSEIGIDCGGRAPLSATFCDAELDDLDNDGLIDAASPGLDRLVGECKAGDMTSCELLFLATPPDTDPSTVGFTCGEREARPSVSCIELFGATATD